MSRRFTLVTIALTAVVAFLVGAIVAGGVARSSISAVSPAAARAGRDAVRPVAARLDAPPLSFADIVERINPAVVNIDATSRGRDPVGRLSSYLETKLAGSYLSPLSPCGISAWRIS